ncbi:ComEC/Rec2 family competence protein [Roseivirga sp.]|uniref:ComEC/Rec2 family competence protein n=1 Tax=Roseivirga sp. TaxID=1964215 RepID=UPI003B52A658
MIFQRYPFLRFSLFFILGIVSRHYLGETVMLPAWALGFLFLVYLWLMRKYSLRNQRYLAMLGFLLLFNLGAYRLDFFLIEDSSIDHEILAYKAQVISDPEQKARSIRAVIEVYEVYSDSSWVSAVGRVNAYFAQELAESLRYGDLIWVKGSPQTTEPPANPGAFDYANYLAYQNIRYQQFIGDEFEPIGNEAPNQLEEMAIDIREKAVSLIKQYVPDPRAGAVVLALVLGVKDDLDNELIQSFSATGAMHVLAVSGLHVGIIYGMLFWLLKRLRWHKRKYRWAMFFISLTVLWAYALLTGLAPSVLRAVTMFSFVAMGRALFRKGNIYNTLALSALALLIYNPYLIMSVGFQLSFLAVFGIVFLQPRLYQLWQPRFWLLDKAWAITCVSIAAQLATAPLSMLYFHQFPSYFLISNLFIIPAAFAILSCGLLLLALSWLPALDFWIGKALTWFVTLVNQTVEGVSRFPGSTIEGIYFSIADTWIIYALLLALIAFWVNKKKQMLRYAIALALAFSVSQISHWKEYVNTYEVSVLDVSGQSAIDLRSGFNFSLIADSSFLADKASQQFNLSGKRLLAGQAVDDQNLPIVKTSFEFGELAVIHGRSVLWLNKKVRSKSALSIVPDVLVISHNAIENEEELEAFSHSGQIVVDRTNSYRTQNTLMKLAKEKSLNMHVVAFNGYFSSLWRK